MTRIAVTSRAWVWGSVLSVACFSNLNAVTESEDSVSTAQYLAVAEPFVDQRQNPTSPECNPDWHAQLVDKEGHFELGAELLYMTSSLSPAYTQPVITDSPSGTVQVNTSRLGRIAPEYNFGVAVDLRCRTKTNSDVGLYYKYIKNNGDGELKAEDVVRGKTGSTSTVIQDDNAHDYNHIHLADLMFGRTYALSEQSVLRVAGGLSFYRLHYRFTYQDVDQLLEPLTPLTVFQNIRGMQNSESWGVGPKLGIDLEYYLLPRCWKHDFNMFLNTEFGLFYTKEWSQGRLSVFQESNNGGSINEFTSITNWKSQPGFEMTPNINLDVGMRYRCHTSEGYAFNVAAGYRVLAFWYTEELFRHRSFSGGEDSVFTSLEDSNLMYSGPYLRLSFEF